MGFKDFALSTIEKGTAAIKTSFEIAKKLSPKWK